MALIGLMGGTFDPPHHGHLAAAEEVRHRLGLEEILWVPAGNPPHKAHLPITAAAHRLAMLRLALRENPRFRVELYEIERPAPSYTADTLRALRERHPSDELVFLLGSDEFASLAAWREPHVIPKLARLAVMARARVRYDTSEVERAVPEVAGRYEIVPVPDLPLSSSALRDRVRSGLPIRYLVPDPVCEYIERTGLYNAGTPPRS